MLEGLLGWEIQSPVVSELGLYSEKINNIVSEILPTLDASDDFPDNYTARNFARSIDARLKSAPVTADNAFDALALAEFKHNLDVQRSTLRFFFTPDDYRKNRRGNKVGPKRSVHDFLNTAFMDEKDSLARAHKGGMRKRASVVNFLEKCARDMDSSLFSERRKLLKDFEKRPFDGGDEIDLEIMLNEFNYVRKVINTYNEQLGFLTSEQTRAADVRAEERAKVLRDILEAQRKGINTPLVGKYTPPAWNGNQRDTMHFDLIVSPYDFSYADNINQTLAMRFSLMPVARDENGDLISYNGDLLRIAVGHENIHHLQAWMSRKMPPGLGEKLDVSSLSTDTMVEGIATYLEDWFMRWYEKQDQFPMDEKDRRAMKIGRVNVGYQGLAALLYTIYKEENFYDNINKKTDARRKLARAFGNQAFLEDEKMPQDSFSAVHYEACYWVGEAYTERIIKHLHKMETARLGSADKSTEFIEQARPHIMQGLLTGKWGWKTREKFFLEHYWPKALAAMGETK